jgi:hypothetical protein
MILNRIIFVFRTLVVYYREIRCRICVPEQVAS